MTTLLVLSLAAGAITCGLATALVKPIHEAAAPIVGPLVGMATAAALSVVMILNNADNEVAIAKAGGIEPLVALARGGTEEQKEEAAAALRNLTVSYARNLTVSYA